MVLIQVFFHPQGHCRSNYSDATFRIEAVPLHGIDQIHSLLSMPGPQKTCKPCAPKESQAPQEKLSFPDCTNFGELRLVRLMQFNTQATQEEKESKANEGQPLISTNQGISQGTL